MPGLGYVMIVWALLSPKTDNILLGLCWFMTKDGLCKLFSYEDSISSFERQIKKSQPSSMVSILSLNKNFSSVHHSLNSESVSPMSFYTLRSISIIL